MPQEVKYQKKILCLANSRKMSGRCLAGKEIKDGRITGWIRPVSEREHQEVSESDRRYKDGTTASLLDIITIPMLKKEPAGYQSENHVIADQYYWKKSGRATWSQIEDSIDSIDGPLWLNGYSSSNGPNDRIPQHQLAKVATSLVLVRPRKLKIIVASKGDPRAPDKRSVRAQFSLNGEPYNLGLTDSLMERRYLKGKNGTFPVDNALLCISLGEPFKGYAYKLAAALITKDRVIAGDD